MKWINDIEPIYSRGIEERNGLYVCTVCGKKYKQSKRANTHIEKRNCHSYYQLLKNTLTEELMYKLYTSILNELNNKSYVSLDLFRKKKNIYNALARYVTYTQRHSLTNDHVINYFLYVYFNKASNITQASNYAANTNILKEFREFMIKNPELINSEEFFDKNKDKMLNDTSFVVRSIERGEVSVFFVIENLGDEFIEGLSTFEEKRVQDTLSIVEG